MTGLRIKALLALLPRADIAVNPGVADTGYRQGCGLISPIGCGPL